MVWKCFEKEKHINIHYSSYFHPLGNSFRNGNKCYSLLHLKACMHDMRKGNKAPHMDQSSSASALRPAILRSLPIGQGSPEPPTPTPYPQGGSEPWPHINHSGAFTTAGARPALNQLQWHRMVGAQAPLVSKASRGLLICTLQVRINALFPQIYVIEALI